MMKMFVLFATSVALFISCNKNNGETPGDGSVDYSWMEGNVSVNVNNTVDVSRISPLTKSENEGAILAQPAKLTSTCIAFLNNDLAVVSYHGRDKAMIGMLELIKCENGEFSRSLGTMTFNDSRVNNIVTDGNRIFAAIDKSNGPVLAMIEVENDAFKEASSLNTIRLNGESANGLTLLSENGMQYIYTATGSDGNAELDERDTEIFSFDGKSQVKQSDFLRKAGFQKIRIEGTKLMPVFSQGNQNNRGKWVATDGKSIITMHTSTYPNPSVGTYTNFRLQFFIEPPKTNFFKRDLDLAPVSTSWGRDNEGKNQCVLTEVSPTEKLLYVCASDKGLQSFKIDCAQTPVTIENIDIYQKYAISVAVDADNVYLASGETGVRVISSQNGVMTQTKYFKVSPVEGQKMPSANFVTVKGDYVYVAYGTAGVFALNRNSAKFVN